MRTRSILLQFCFCLLSFSLFAQPTSSAMVLDGVYVRENNYQRKPIPYNFESESNLMWTKRVWRVIDLREKINLLYYYPTTPTRGMRNLFTVIKDGICSGELTAYQPLSDEFLYHYESSEACSLGTSVDTIFQENDAGELITVPIYNELPIENIRRFRIKEDWYFDSKRGVMETRIIGIVPVEEVFDDLGEYKGERPMYWIYMPELRFTIANAPAPNPRTDVERRTYDDLFNLRRFSSYVSKESSVYDRALKSYKEGIDLLLEGKKIEDDIFKYEQDLWEY